jgi:glutathione S-transferase
MQYDNANLATPTGAPAKLAKSSWPSLRLWYLDHHFWRAECVRLCLFMNNVPFEDRRVGYDELYGSGMLTFGTFPSLEVNGRAIAQTHAMAAYVGKLTGMYPSDPWLQAKVDEIFGGLTDATELITGTMSIRDPERKIQTRQQMCQRDGRLTMLLSGIESVLQQNGGNGLVAGDTITVADLALWRAVNWISCGTLDGIPTDYISRLFPNLWNCHCQLDRLPEVQEWKRRNPRHYKK